MRAKFLGGLLGGTHRFGAQYMRGSCYNPYVLVKENGVRAYFAEKYESRGLMQEMNASELVELFVHTDTEEFTQEYDDASILLREDLDSRFDQSRKVTIL